MGFEPKDIERFIYEQKLLLAQHSECATAHYNLGVALLQQGKLDEALMPLKRP